MLLVQCVTSHNSCSLTHNKAVELNTLADKVTSFLRHDSYFAPIIKSVMNFRIAFQSEHGVFFIAAQIGEIVNVMFVYYLRMSNSSWTYHLYIDVAHILQERPKILDKIEQIIGKRTDRKLDIRSLD